MKIGILTLRLHKNYGGILQNYALNKVLRNLGHDVETVDFFWDIRLKGIHKFLSYSKRIIKNILFSKWQDIRYEEILVEKDKITTQYTTRFKRQYIPFSAKRYLIPTDDLRCLNGIYDAIVVGSDQVWRPRYTKGIYKYFLSFLNDDSKTIRLAYAVSFGTDKDEYTSKQKKICRRFLKKFRAVSVREADGGQMIHKIFNCNIPVKHVLDPTMLLKHDDYERLFVNREPINQVFQYILDNNEDSNKLSKLIQSSLGLAMFTLTPDGIQNQSETIIPPIEEWLASIRNSKFVFTDSFHGTVFSIIFNTPFIVYVNETRGLSRLKSLLSMFGLEERLVSDLNNFNIELCNNTIDWIGINSKVDELRKVSLRFLTENLF